jgi:5-(carboxyamino)imidazole ribonucleotide synthase
MTRIGILGGGQLAQMLTQAAAGLGLETAIFERSADSPAARLTQHEIVAAWEDQAAQARFAGLCNLATLENEFVDAGILQRLASLGLPVHPASDCLAAIQDKLYQKQRLAEAGLPLPRFAPVADLADLRAQITDFGLPLLLKARRDGYDGYGNATIRSLDDIEPAWQRLGAGSRALLIEAFVPFERELAVMVLRGQDGELRTYPVVETVQQNHICHVVRAPAALPAEVLARAEALALQAVDLMSGVGVFGVEMFQLADGSVLYNEMAPRPHNSGHYTIEACVTSQFENHLRAVLGWPLGSTALRVPAAVMVNTLGRRAGPVGPEHARPALAVAGASLHFYGKRQGRLGRKMGHITALSSDLATAEQIARQAAALVEY